MACCLGGRVFGDMKFTLEVDQEDGLWFVTSPELNAFLCHHDLAVIMADIPNVLELVQQRDQSGQSNK